MKKAIAMLNGEVQVQWLPAYGSAMIAHRGELQPPGRKTISILGLDRHSFFLHHDDADGYLHEADALDYKILIAGTIEENKLEAFWKRFQQLHSAAQARDGDRRTAVGGRQGHQFTPTLVHALATQAVECSCDGGSNCACPNVIPKGGFTDVGRHTGGEKRNTSFALVKFLLEWCLVQCSFADKVLFRKVMLCIHLCVATDRVIRAEEDCEDAEGEAALKLRADVDVPFRILEVISMEGDELYKSGVPINFVNDKGKELRLRQDQIVERLAQSEANRFILPNVDSLLLDPDAFRSPKICLPEEDSTEPACIHDYDVRIKKNIGPTSVLEDASTFDLAGLLAWLNSSDFQGKGDSTTVLLRLRTVENVFWNRALEGFDTCYLNEAEVVLLFDVIQEYRKIFHNSKAGLGKGGLLLTELRSRELLVVWIAYCLAYAAAKHTFGHVMANVGVALRYSDLEHLVLSDHKSCSVLEKVAAFLNQNYLSEKNELFSFRAPDAALHFAETYGRNDHSLQSIWNAERQDAELRMDKHWEQVQRQKRKAERLRSEIRDLRQKLTYAEAEMDRERSSYNRKLQYDEDTSRAKLSQATRKVNSIKGDIASSNRCLEATLRAPSPVCQPLPKAESNALQWLFFLHMPPIFRVLSTLSLTGQQMLVPRPWKALCDGPDGTELVDVLQPLLLTKGDCLSVFYNRYQSCEFHTPNERRHGARGNVALVSPRPVAEVRPKTIGPTSVDDMVTKEHGVWYPDSVAYVMEWTGGSLSWDCRDGQSFDPFRVPRKWVISYFTEKLESEENSLQWAMRLEENSDVIDERGNRSLATQEARPDWLSKPQFLEFCRMRGFPNQQLRHLVCALVDRSLPFGHSAVHSLLKQTLFHVGRVDIDAQNNVHLGWKGDLNDHEFFVTIRAILEHYVDELVESPSKYLSALIIGDIAGFLSDWDSKFKAISRELGQAAYKWAEDFARQAEATEKAADSMSFRVRQRLLLNVSIICLSQGPLSDDDVRLIVERRAIAKNLCVDEEEESEQRAELSRIEQRCDCIIALRIDEVLAVVKGRLSFPSDVIRSVIAKVPRSLRWELWRSGTSTFVASGSDGCLYAVNVLTGVVLVNGLPPSSLPSEILEHELYKRSFGNRNFEIVSKNEVYETVRQVGGFLYSFTVKNDGSLCVVETSQDEERLELLDGTANGIERWAEELPTRLKQMHSHWLSRDTNVLLLRGRTFFQREVYFILDLPSSKDNIGGNCRLVPDHMKGDDWREMVQSSSAFAQLVLHDSDLLRVLAKFEERQFVHFLIFDDPSSLRVSLPRYGLTLVYHDRQFQCAEIHGFVLTNCQQLKGALFGFERYLVLQKDTVQSEEARATSILVADGGIEHEKLGGSTFVRISDDCDEDVAWHKYDIHPRFQTYSASTVSSRLYLAALHASTSFSSPDCDSLQTGFERAIELARGSWVARAHSNVERTCLSRLLMVCKGRHAALTLLCSELSQSSKSVSFLHGYTADSALGSDAFKARSTLR